MNINIDIDENDSSLTMLVDDLHLITAYTHRGTVKFKGLAPIIDDPLYDVLTAIAQQLLSLCKKD
jgi:hypothetical protein